MKNAFITTIGIFGSIIASLFGGWTASLTTLLIFMGVDYLTGLIVAGVFHQSPKTVTGALESRAGFKGLIRKGMILLLVLVGHRLDLAIGASYIRDAICIAFISRLCGGRFWRDGSAEAISSMRQVATRGMSEVKSSSVSFAVRVHLSRRISAISHCSRAERICS